MISFIFTFFLHFIIIQNSKNKCLDKVIQNLNSIDMSQIFTLNVIKINIKALECF